MDCVFCKIISGEFNSHKVYEDDICIGFLDINPINNGHVLVVPKKHSTSMEDTEDKILFHLISTVKKIYKSVMEAVNADGITIVENYGLLQEVEHIHFHIIPTFKEFHGISFNLIDQPEKLDIVREKIKNKILSQQ